MGVTFTVYVIKRKKHPYTVLILLTYRKEKQGQSVFTPCYDYLTVRPSFSIITTTLSLQLVGSFTSFQVQYDYILNNRIIKYLQFVCVDGKNPLVNCRLNDKKTLRSLTTRISLTFISFFNHNYLIF